ncbi:MAG: DHH family phosphoesterase [Planctomycetota bacterium]|nr:DHH family phosphoesterase [Planctomycetota bacterium]
MSDFTYETNTTVEAIADRLRSARSVLITSHEKPDGDAIGSCAALARALRALGVEVEVWLLGAVTPNLAALAEDLAPRHAPPDQPGGDHDLCVVVDTGAWSQLGPLREYLATRRDSVIGIDHHRRGDDIAAMRFVDPTAASCTQVLVPLIDALGVPLTAGGNEAGWFTIAEAILLGLATDTGWFRFESFDAPGFTLGARLMEAGADKNRLIRQVEECDRPQRIHMAGRALSAARFFHQDQAVVMTLSLEDFAAVGARPEELSGIVNQPMSVGGVEVSVLLTQSEPGRVKGSFRSKPPLVPGSSRFVDVNQVAARFGGGGHVHAAGARFEGTLDEVVEAVRAALEAALQDAGFTGASAGT